MRNTREDIEGVRDMITTLYRKIEDSDEVYIKDGWLTTWIGLNTEDMYKLEENTLTHNMIQEISCQLVEYQGEVGIYITTGEDIRHYYTDLLQTALSLLLGDLLREIKDKVSKVAYKHTITSIRRIIQRNTSYRVIHKALTYYLESGVDQRASKAYGKIRRGLDILTLDEEIDIHINTRRLLKGIERRSIYKE